MSSTQSDTLSATLQTRLSWSRVDTQDVGSVTDKSVANRQYDLTDGAGVSQADLVFTDTRTIGPNSLDELDLLNLSQNTLGVTVPYVFRQLRLVRIVNNATTAGRRLLVGVDPGRPTSVYAAEIGPGAEWINVNPTDAWQVTSANSILRIANPNASSLSYTIYLLGTSTAP